MARSNQGGLQMARSRRVAKAGCKWPAPNQGGLQMARSRWVAKGPRPFTHNGLVIRISICAAIRATFGVGHALAQIAQNHKGKCFCSRPTGKARFLRYHQIKAGCKWPDLFNLRTVMPDQGGLHMAQNHLQTMASL